MTGSVKQSIERVKQFRSEARLPVGQINSSSNYFLSSATSKNISLRRYPKSLLKFPPSRPTEGRLAIVTDAGRDAVDAGGAADESAGLRTAKSCGPDAPTLASSWRKQFRWRQWQESPVTGESAK
jgi:hypothetical protein